MIIKSIRIRDENLFKTFVATIFSSMHFCNSFSHFQGFRDVVLMMLENFEVLRIWIWSLVFLRIPQCCWFLIIHIKWLISTGINEYSWIDNIMYVIGSKLIQTTWNLSSSLNQVEIVLWSYFPQTFKALTTCLDHQHSNISKPLLENHQTIKYNDKKIWIHAAKMFLKKTWRNIENNLFANKSFSNKTLPYNKILFSFISSVDSLIHLTVFFAAAAASYFLTWERK